MDKVWKQLSYDCLEHIARFADIDTRRAMGFKPRKLPKINFNPKPMPPIEYRYYINEKKLWYFEMDGYLNFYFDVISGVELIDSTVPLFRYMDNAHQIHIIYNEHTSRYRIQVPDEFRTFQTAGYPILISSVSTCP